MNENKKEISGFRGVGGVKLTLRIITVFAALMCVLSALAAVVVYSCDMIYKSQDEMISKMYSEYVRKESWKIFSHYVYDRGEDVMEEGIKSANRDFYVDIYYCTDGSEKLVYSESDGKDHSFKYEFVMDESQSVSYIFRCFLNNELDENGELHFIKEKLLLIYRYRNECVPFTFVFGTVALIFFVVLLKLAGRKAGYTGVYKSFGDRIPLDLYLGLLGALVIASAVSLVAAGKEVVQTNFEYLKLYSSVAQTVIVVDLYLTVRFFESLAVSLKAGKMWKNTVVYIFITFVMRCIATAVKGITEAMLSFTSVWKVTAIAAGVVFVSAFLFLYGIAERSVFAFMVFLLLLLCVSAVIVAAAVNIKKLNEFAKIIYDGDYVKKIRIDDLYGEFKEQGVYLNGISNGMSKVLNEKIKSERMKTELITNVSHDIKTPLTSIINYTDLIKKEEPENENIREYIDVIDRQSQKLKKLVCDIVDASKASSGALTVSPVSIDLSVMISQICGEYDSRMKEKALTRIMQLDEEEAYINADPALLQRIFDNLFINICNYAHRGTRVYITLKTFEDEYSVVLKNISEYPLNITGDELMERFVRGDSSRNSEGSGLGLSIAKSLTELMGGTFLLEIDGDLFKAELRFRKERGVLTI